MEYREYDSYNVQVFKDTRERSLGEYVDETKALIGRTKVYEDLSGVVFEEPVKQEIEFKNTRTITAGIGYSNVPDFQVTLLIIFYSFFLQITIFLYDDLN